MTATVFDRDVALRQIGRSTRLAVSGGLVYDRHPEHAAGESSVTALIFPVRYGYRVEVTMRADTYTVRRMFRRGGQTWEKARLEGVHAEQLADAVYRASCYRDPL
jgi:hypothetical protein